MITRTQGNAFEVIVPLYTRTLHEDGTIDIAEYTPQDDDVIIVTLAGCRNYRYNAEGGDKCCIFKMTGAEVAGIYALEVVIIQADGRRLRYAVKEALQLTCETSEDDVQGAEFTASGVTLDAAWFFFAKGDKGDDGIGIVNIAKIGSVGLIDTYRILYTDGGITTFEVTNGKNGTNGRGIQTITKTSSEGLVDTYTIYYTDGTTSTYTVTNGKDGEGGDVDAYTKAESDARFAKRNDATQTITAQGVNVSSVVFSGGNLNTDDDGYLRYEGDKVLVEGDAVPLNRKINDKPLSSDVVLDGNDISVNVQKSAESLDTRTVTLQALLYGYNTTKQATLVSGENIKTINGEDILGEGDITIQGGAEVVQTTGQATDKVMSQKAVTDIIGNVESLLSSI